MKAQALNFLATSHRFAISPFRGSLSFFSLGAQIDGGKKHGGNETWTAIYFSRSSFVKRFASLATAFPPMTLRLYVLASLILPDSFRVRWYRVVYHAIRTILDYHSKNSSFGYINYKTLLYRIIRLQYKVSFFIH